MSQQQSMSEPDMREFLLKASTSQIKETPTTQLLQVYNHITGRDTKKFSSREQGLSQVIEAIDEFRARDGVMEQLETEVGADQRDFNTLSASEQADSLEQDAEMSMETLTEQMETEVAPIMARAVQASERPFRIKLPYSGHTRQPKKASKRAMLLARMTDGYGITIEELADEPFSWPRKDAYEGLRHIHVSLGYGIDQYPDGRIYAHTDEPGKHMPHEQRPFAVES